MRGVRSGGKPSTQDAELKLRMRGVMWCYVVLCGVMSRKAVNTRLHVLHAHAEPKIARVEVSMRLLNSDCACAVLCHVCECRLRACIL